MDPTLHLSILERRATSWLKASANIKTNIPFLREQLRKIATSVNKLKIEILQDYKPEIPRMQYLCASINETLKIAWKASYGGSAGEPLPVSLQVKVSPTTDITTSTYAVPLNITSANDADTNIEMVSGINLEASPPKPCATKNPLVDADSIAVSGHNQPFMMDVNVNNHNAERSVTGDSHPDSLSVVNNITMTLIPKQSDELNRPHAIEHHKCVSEDDTHADIQLTSVDKTIAHNVLLEEARYGEATVTNTALRENAQHQFLSTFSSCFTVETISISPSTSPHCGNNSTYVNKKLYSKTRKRSQILSRLMWIQLVNAFRFTPHHRPKRLTFFHVLSVRLRLLKEDVLDSIDWGPGRSADAHHEADNDRVPEGLEDPAAFTTPA